MLRTIYIATDYVVCTLWEGIPAGAPIRDNFKLGESRSLTCGAASTVLFSKVRFRHVQVCILANPSWAASRRASNTNTVSVHS
jgi:hypothetical protein